MAARLADYRARHGITDDDRALGHQPPPGTRRWAYEQMATWIRETVRHIEHADHAQAAPPPTRSLEL